MGAGVPRGVRGFGFVTRRRSGGGGEGCALSNMAHDGGEPAPAHGSGRLNGFDASGGGWAGGLTPRFWPR